jgi:hypothetical protein
VRNPSKGCYQFVSVKNLGEFCHAFYGAFAKWRKATISYVVSVRLSARMEQIGSHWADFEKNLIFETFFFENLSRKSKFHKNPTRMTGILHEDVFTFLTISH